MSLYLNIAKKVSKMQKPVPAKIKSIEELEVPAFLRVKKEFSMFTK